jgi:hypothetical protein
MAYGIVVGGSTGTKRRAAKMLSDFEFKAKPGAPSPGGGGKRGVLM